MSEAPVTPEAKSDYTFGQIAIKENICSFEQVKECLDIQNRLRSIGIEPKRLGEILIEKGYLTPEQIAQVSRVQQSQPQTVKLSIPGYELIQKLGQGAMGAVFKAKQLSMDRLVAIKVLSPKYGKDRAFVERFLREARAVARLNHENVISGIDVGEAGNLHYFVMEFVDGLPVSKLLKTEGRLEEKRAINIALQISRALDHAYKHEMVHRDVKPENIMLTQDGIAKLCDLGLAKQTKGDASLTMDGMSVGTPNYISPEQARGEQDIDIRSDIYSLGASLYHMVTGTTPFAGENPTIVMTKHVTDPPEPPRKRNPAISEGLDNLILKMMAKHRDERPQDPAALIGDLERLLSGGTVAAPTLRPITHPPTRRLTDTPRPEARHVASAPRSAAPRPEPSSGWAGKLVGAAVLIVLAGGGVIVFTQMNGPRTQNSTNVVASNPSGTVDPSHGGDSSKLDQASFDRDLETFRSFRDHVLDSANDPERYTKPHARCEEYIQTYRGTPFEMKWMDELKAYKELVNKLILEKEWGPTEDQARKLRNEGKYAQAIERAGKLDDVYKAFSKTVPTDAAQKQAALLGELRRAFDENFADEKNKASVARGKGEYDLAYQIVGRMTGAYGDDKGSDLRKFRSEILDAELNQIIGETPSPTKFAKARERIGDLVAKFAQDAEFVRELDLRREGLKKSESEAATGAVEKAKYIYNEEVADGFRRALQRRDLLSARKVLFEAYFGDKFAAGQPVFWVSGLDAKSLKDFLDPARVTPGEGSAVVAQAEAGFHSAQMASSETAASLCLDLRVYALLDDLLEQAAKGAELLARDGKMRECSDSVKTAIEMKPITRKPEDFRIRMHVKRSVGGSAAEEDLNLAPRDSSSPTDSDIAVFARRAAGPAFDKDPYASFRLGLLFLFGGDKAGARGWLLAAKSNPPLAFDRYWDLVKGVASAKEEKEAREKFKRAIDASPLSRKIKLTKDQYVALLKDLRDNYVHTEYLTTLKDDQGRPIKARIEWVLEELRGAEGGAAPRKSDGKPSDPFAGVYVQKGARCEVTYDFSKEEELKDFTAVSPQASITATKQDKGVRLKGSGYWFWKAPVKGSLQIDMQIRSHSDQGIGFIFYSDPANAMQKGYTAYADFKIPFGGNKSAMITKFPLGSPQNWQQFVVAQGGRKVQLAKDTNYNVRIVRDGKKITLTFNDVVAVEGESDTYNDGSIGIALGDSEIQVEKFKVNVEIDKVWIEEQLKK